MKYGDHVDSALMGGNNGIRTDFAMTVFLSAPSSYEGGELIIPGAGQIKLDVGEAYVYPATSIHRVQPVTSGVRLAVVTWFQSAVRDQILRGILFDLARGIQRAETLGDFDHQLLLTKCYQNLIRYAAEPR
jgi:PKHD-type hydroxylase